MFEVCNSLNSFRTYAFSSTKSPVDWKKIASLDIDRIIAERDIETLVSNLGIVTSFDAVAEFKRTGLNENFLKLFRFSQLGIDFLSHCKTFLQQHLLETEAKLHLLKQELAAYKRGRKSAIMKSDDRKQSRLVLSAEIEAAAFKCSICRKVFVNGAYLKKHEVRRHSKSSSSSDLVEEGKFRGVLKPVQKENKAISKCTGAPRLKHSCQDASGDGAHLTSQFFAKRWEPLRATQLEGICNSSLGSQEVKQHPLLEALRISKSLDNLSKEPFLGDLECRNPGNKKSNVSEQPNSLKDHSNTPSTEKERKKDFVHDTQGCSPRACCSKNLVSNGEKLEDFLKPGGHNPLRKLSSKDLTTTPNESEPALENTGIRQRIPTENKHKVEQQKIEEYIANNQNQNCHNTSSDLQGSHPFQKTNSDPDIKNSQIRLVKLLHSTYFSNPEPGDSQFIDRGMEKEDCIKQRNRSSTKRQLKPADRLEQLLSSMEYERIEPLNGISSFQSLEDQERSTEGIEGIESEKLRTSPTLKRIHVKSLSPVNPLHEPEEDSISSENKTNNTPRESLFQRSNETLRTSGGVSDCFEKNSIESTDESCSTEETSSSIHEQIDQKSLRSDVEKELNTKLRELGIDPEWKKIPDGVVDHKKKVLSAERSLMAKRYTNFLDTRKNLNGEVERKLQEITRDMMGNS